MHDVVRVVRPGTIEDQPLLERIVAITVFWRPEDKDRSIEDLESYRRIRLYVDSWGRDGDAAVVAQDGDQSVGAAWYRYFTAEDPGWGFVAPDVPEVAIGIIDGYRGAGFGRAMLEALIEHARADGVRGLSLSVDMTNNRALNLYRNTGFEVVGVNGGHYTMLLDLSRGQT